MLTFRRIFVPALALVCIGLPPAMAQAQGALPSGSFSGFGTLGFASLDDDDAEYRTGFARDGADAEGSLELDSRLGLQLDARLTRRLSGTLQVTAREGAEGEPVAALEWGLLRILATDTIGLRVGRMSLPIFSLSDFREVGYANVLLRPPEDVYAQIPLRRFDGLDITVDGEAMGTLLRAQLFAGESSERIYDSLELDGKELRGIALSAERGPLRLRVSHVSSQLEVTSANGDIARLHGGLLQASAVVPMLAELAADFAPGRATLTFDGIGASFDPGGWFVDLEYARRRVDVWVSDVDSVSLAGGFRIASVTPYAFVSRLDEVQGDRRVTLPDTETLAALEDGLNAFYEPRDQQSLGVGLRWDPIPDIALKAQLERISREETGVSFLRREVDDGTDEGADVLLFSAALDFVF